MQKNTKFNIMLLIFIITAVTALAIASNNIDFKDNNKNHHDSIAEINIRKLCNSSDLHLLLNNQQAIEIAESKKVNNFLSLCNPDIINNVLLKKYTLTQNTPIILDPNFITINDTTFYFPTITTISKITEDYFIPYNGEEYAKYSFSINFSDQTETLSFKTFEDAFDARVNILHHH